jgi:hypothetical protein
VMPCQERTQELTGTGRTLCTDGEWQQAGETAREKSAARGHRRQSEHASMQVQ